MTSALAYADAPPRCAPLADLFIDYTQAGPGHNTHLAAQLASVCAGCGLLTACRTVALADPSIPGFVGGLTPLQRAAIRRRGGTRRPTVSDVDERAVERAMRGERIVLSHEERGQAVQRLQERGLTPSVIARRLRMSGARVNQLLTKGTAA